MSNLIPFNRTLGIALVLACIAVLPTGMMINEKACAVDGTWIGTGGGSVGHIEPVGTDS